MKQHDPKGTHADGFVRGVRESLDALESAGELVRGEPAVREVGEVLSVDAGVARVKGLPGAAVDELIRFQSGAFGMVADLTADGALVTLLSAAEGTAAGTRADRTGEVLTVPVGAGLLGRVIDPLGTPRDGGGSLRATRRLPVERPAAPIFERAPVSRPLHTGVKAIDALFPIGRGQRELLIGDRQTGKSSVALATILAQATTGVRCVYCAVGQRSAQVARVVQALRENGALAYTTVVVATSHDPAALRMLAPFAATSVGEAFMEAGEDALVVFDDLTQHGRAYRELSLLLRRPPGREAYPGDVFYLHARLLERAAQLSAARGGGSLTALPVVEIQERDLSAYIPTNVISITDGQIVLSPDLAARGVLPAVDIGLSVSRVGGKAQPPALRAVAGRLRLSYAQFEELERFARFGAEVDEATRRALVRGRAIRAALQQGALETVPAPEQVALLTAVTAGALDGLSTAAVRLVERDLAARLKAEYAELSRRVADGEPLGEDDQAALVSAASAAVERVRAEERSA